MKLETKCVYVGSLCFILFKVVYAQGIIDTLCTVTATKAPGVCKLLNDCKIVRDEVLLYQKLPQTCGFQGTQSIVCCPVMNKPRQPGDISRQKCKEYSSYEHDGTTECGHIIIKRIVNGIMARKKEFSHMAALGFVKLTTENVRVIRWLCGGSLISDQYVLTAAACLHHPVLGKVQYVVVGVTNFNDTNNFKQEIKIIDWIAHPDYKSPSVYHDIGLLKLEKRLEFNAYVRPACLNLNSRLSVDKLIATGWGTTSFRGNSSNDLLKVTTNVIENSVCNQSYLIGRNLKNGIVEDMQICVSDVEEHKDTCQGDAGGPLQTHHTSDDILCMYDIVGIISFGKGCGGELTVATRVSRYIEWIENIVWPEVPTS